ncbi:lipocalin-like domain-containing protein [Streptomyces sp. P17]|uniref:lipocalin-like domain-containing protein n=1 Tax=Streptomyces sp. P17 TaxID=3074716 RepID=UPI0028F45E02|nr:glycoside hydrolase family 43 C-terminal domain-containing protein [Streptomyces sp. P17]MDT9695258.1 glycoside hydrolase family 43 C-terminal domain-containing protein [Streptomyces sp. P17]
MEQVKPWGRTLILGIAAMGLTVLTACAGPYQYYEGTGLDDATVAEVAGSWKSIEGTRMTLRPDGTALLRRLDGQDFDFDDGWRVSGRGTWEMTDDADGQDVHLTMTTRTGVAMRAAADASAATEPPTTYEWRFSLRRDQRDALELFFFYGDPDIGNTYLMTRAVTLPRRDPSVQ